MILRSYQELGIADIRAAFLKGAKRVCYTAPTGSGKTVLFCHAAKKVIENGQRALVVVHRQELVDQTCAALAAEGAPFGVIAAGAGYPETADAPVQVAMAQTLVRRLERLSGIALAIFDECHHLLAETWLTVLGAIPDARVLGASATPERLDGKGLGAVFDDLVIGPSVAELIAAGWLSQFVVYAPEHTVDLKGARTVAGDYALGDLRRMSDEVVIADAVHEYRERVAGRSALAFCTTIQHSYAVARAFRAAGIAAAHIDGDASASERRSLISGRQNSGSLQLRSHQRGSRRAFGRRRDPAAADQVARALSPADRTRVTSRSGERPRRRSRSFGQRLPSRVSRS